MAAYNRGAVGIAKRGGRMFYLSYDGDKLQYLDTSLRFRDHVYMTSAKKMFYVPSYVPSHVYSSEFTQPLKYGGRGRHISMNPQFAGDKLRRALRSRGDRRRRRGPVRLFQRRRRWRGGRHDGGLHAGRRSGRERGDGGERRLGALRGAHLWRGGVHLVRGHRGEVSDRHPHSEFGGTCRAGAGKDSLISSFISS